MSDRTDNIERDDAMPDPTESSPYEHSTMETGGDVHDLNIDELAKWVEMFVPQSMQAKFGWYKGVQMAFPWNELSLSQWQECSTWSDWQCSGLSVWWATSQTTAAREALGSICRDLVRHDGNRQPDSHGGATCWPWSHAFLA